jgi:hypothetical protein
MAESVASRNERLKDYIADVTHVSLHSALPNDSGSSELSGGTPAYARKVPSFSTPGTGVTTSDLTGSLVFDIPTGGAPSHYGLWKGTTFLGGEPLTAAQPAYAGPGTYTLTSLPLSA